MGGETECEFMCESQREGGAAGYPYDDAGEEDLSEGPCVVKVVH